MRLLLPRRRGGAGLSRLSAQSARPGAFAALLALALALALLLSCGCGDTHRAQRAAVSSRAGVGTLDFGLTEENANLLWSPAVTGRRRFQRAREQLSALHPAYVRLLIDWAALQPLASRPPALDARASGCARVIAPCAAYAGVREELAAIATQQRSEPGFQVVIVIFGTPTWAARSPSGCERGSRGAFSRAPSAAGLGAYRALIHALSALGAREGVPLQWWAPWNEPNDPTFLAPQRASCLSGASPRSAGAYAELVRAMAAQLGVEGGQRHIVLGELNAYANGSPQRLSPAEFLAALPSDVACLGSVWSVHAYAARGRFATSGDPVAVLEHALMRGGECARAAPIWVTEAGAGAPHPGDPRGPAGPDEIAGCEALATQLLAWERDARVSAVFQYTFRDDPAFPVGLINPALSHIYPAYRLWLSLAEARAGARAPMPLASACR